MSTKTNPGNFFEDFRMGQRIVHATPRTVTEGDVALYTALYGSRFAVNSSAAFAASLGLPRAPLDDLLAFNVVFGKTVPDIRKPKKGEENLFPKFTTWREQIDGKYWFPTYTKADDTLHFALQNVHIREIVKYENYQRFGSKVKITYEGKEVEKGGKQPEEQKPPDQKPQ